MKPVRALCALVLLSAAASAQDFLDLDEPHDWYLGFGGGILNYDGTGDVLDSLQIDGWMLAGQLGWRMQPEGRLHPVFEAEGLYTTVDFEDTLFAIGSSRAERFDQGVGLGNLLLEYRLSDDVMLYGGGGVGVASADLSSLEDAPTELEVDDDTLFAWQVKAGFAWDLGGNLGWWAGWRHLETEDVDLVDPTLGATVSIENTVDVLEVGFRWGW